MDSKTDVLRSASYASSLWKPVAGSGWSDAYMLAYGAGQPSAFFIPRFISKYEVVQGLKPKHSHTRRDWNSFEHYVRYASPGTLGKVDLDIGSFNSSYPGFPAYHTGTVPVSALFESFGGADEPLTGLPVLAFPDGEGNLVSPPPNLDSLLSIAEKRLLPGVKQELSSINTVLELKDFKSFLKTAKHLKDSVTRFDNWLHFRGDYQKMSKLSVREIVRRKGDVYLQYKFNVAPLLSDIKGFFKSFKSYQSAAMRLVKNSEKAITRHTVLDVNELDPSDEFHDHTVLDTVSPGIVQLSVRDHREVLPEPSKFHVEMQYSYIYTDFQKRHAALFSFLDSIGAYNNAQTIWNATRWSFVVDWVIGIGPALGRYSSPGMEPKINIRRSLWSIRRSRRIICSVDVGNQQRFPASSVTESAYRRHVYMMTAHSIESSGLDPNEFSLAAALVVTRRPRH